MSKPRRKVTVESGKSLTESGGEKRKPSVFERLGPGGRSYESEVSWKETSTRCDS